MGKTVPFTYFGAKAQSTDFIDSKLPRTRHFIEPYGGSATVLLNRDPVPVETYNDLHGDIPHFFRVLRECPEELVASIRKTPYSREEYEQAIRARESEYADYSDIERARMFYTIMQQSRSNRQHSTESAWTYTVKGSEGRGTDDTTQTWKVRVGEHLPEVAGRLTDIQIENRPAIDVIERHDRETATFYVDPPYVPESRGSFDDYALEMSRDDHRELAAVLDDCEGYVALSGYDSGLYEELFDGWYCYSDIEKGAGDGQGTRQEILWTNYDADELGGEKIGDWPIPTMKGKQLTLNSLGVADD